MDFYFQYVNKLGFLFVFFVFFLRSYKKVGYLIIFLVSFVIVMFLIQTRCSVSGEIGSVTISFKYIHMNYYYYVRINNSH